MKTYDEADAYLKAGRDPNRRTIPSIKATSVERRDASAIALKYHATDVVLYYSNGTLKLNSGGWRTMTTKDRMCQYSPVSVSQDKGLWYVAEPSMGKGPYYFAWDEHVLYFEGIEVIDSGKKLNPPSTREMERMEKGKRKIDRMVSKYIKGYVTHLLEVGHAEKPSNGDCWPCSMKEVGTGKGDMMGYDHLIAHFEEGYYVPSLLISAIDEQNYGGGVGFMLQVIDGNIKRGAEKDGGLWHVVQALRAYFRKRKVKLTEVLMGQGVGV